MEGYNNLPSFFCLINLKLILEEYDKRTLRNSSLY